MQKTKKDRQNERGSALLLVLGILSLVLIMGMSFVFTARTERQVAQANSSQMSAKLIAQSALNRIISDMGYYFRDDDDKPLTYPSVDLSVDAAGADDPITFGLQPAPDSGKGMQFCAISKNLHIGTIDNEEQDHFNELLHLQTFDETNGVYYESLPQLTLIDKGSGKETFVHPITVTYEDASGKKCTDVIGRYGYVILEEGSKIDVNSALSFSGKVPFAPVEAEVYNKLEIKDIVDNFSRIASPYDEATDTYTDATQDYVYYITGSDEKDVTNGSSVEGENTVRLGLSMEEIQLEKKFWDKLPDGSSKVKKAPWVSYAHLANALDKKDFSKESFNYTFFSGEDIEAFWDADAKKERSRFDLTGFTAFEKEPGTTDANIDYSYRMEHNFWELTSSEQSNLQENVKKKIDQLTGASGSYKRAEFWKDIDEGVVYYDENKGFWYEMSADGTITKQEDPVDKKYGGIPLLDKMKDDDDKSVSDQVAANLIDYSDKDDIASTDFKIELGDDGAWAEPTYCGNERVPYINEIDLKVEMTRDADITATGDSYSFKMNVKAMAELVNIYCNGDETGDCEAVPDDLHVQIRVIGEFTVMEVKYAFQLDPTGNNELREIGRTSKTYPMGGDDGYLSLTSANKIPNFHLGYQVMELNGQAFPKGGQTDTDFPQPVYLQTSGLDDVKYYFNYKISQIIAIVYKDTVKNDNLCDVAFFPKEAENYYELLEEDAYSATTATFTGPYILTMQANDPRCNLIAKKSDTGWDEKLWKIMKYDATTGDVPENTLGDDEKGRDNSNFKTAVDDLKNKPTDKDWEHDVTFEESNTRSFSTAFIRNAPMESLWELGAIHRGAPYQTINLKKFKDPNASADPVTPGASGKYSEGDAAILDYVKIGPLRFAKGRVNANTRNLGAIDLLLKDIEGETYDGVLLTTASNDHVKYNLTIDEDDLVDSDKYPVSYNRGVMANLLFDMLDSDVKTDRDAEALIGKTAGLLTTRLDTYSVYIVAEALREMRDIPDDTTFDAIKDTLINPIKVKHYLRKADDNYFDQDEVKTSYCSIAGVQRMLVQLVRDAWRNEIKVERVQYLEK